MKAEPRKENNGGGEKAVSLVPSHLPLSVSTSVKLSRGCNSYFVNN